MSVWSALLRTGVIRPPSGIATAIATLMLSAYVMPLPSGVHAAQQSCLSLLQLAMLTKTKS